jgi:hypothetical protein
MKPCKAKEGKLWAMSDRVLILVRDPADPAEPAKKAPLRACWLFPVGGAQGPFVDLRHRCAPYCLDEVDRAGALVMGEPVPAEDDQLLS